jgi:uncharacterized membrane protein YkgB
MRLRNLPTRLAVGAYVLHTGLEKFPPDQQRAEGIHGMAAGAFPFLRSVAAPTFLRGLSIAEIAIGSALLAPFVPAAVAGAALTGFAGGLVTMYLRTPALHKPGSVWPNQNGIAVSKDVWMLGVGVGLLVDAATQRRGG